MQGRVLRNTVTVSKMFIEKVVKPGFTCVDATTGNGNDTLFLSNLVGKDGYIYGFDIQKLAVENTINKLKKESTFENYKIIEDGHEKMAQYIDQNVDFIIFNLGYLPRADKTIKTHKDTTLVAIESAMSLLKQFGVLWIVVYPGHEEGMEESDALMDFVKTVPQEEFSVMKLQFVNQRNNPPYVLAMEKKV